MLFIPKRTKFKKRQKGKRLNTIHNVGSIFKFNFGNLGLKAIESGHLTSKQINAIKLTINKIIKKKGKLKINIFPNTPISKKPLEVRMGKGKGNVDRWIFKVKTGFLLFEIQIASTAINIALAIAAFKLAQYKIPIKTRIITNY